LHQSNQTKESLRNNALAELKCMGPVTHSRASKQIRERLGQLAENCYNVMAYWPLSTEPDIRALLHALNTHDKSVCLPVTKGKQIIPYRVDDLDKLKPSRLGVHEPHHGSSTPFSHEKLNLVILPGLAFTQGGKRLGRGGGYYDRFLAKLPEKTVKAGIAFERQIHRFIPTLDHDIAMDFVVTESNAYKCATQG